VFRSVRIFKPNLPHVVHSSSNRCQNQGRRKEGIQFVNHVNTSEDRYSDPALRRELIKLVLRLWPTRKGYDPKVILKSSDEEVIVKIADKDVDTRVTMPTSLISAATPRLAFDVFKEYLQTLSAVG
jgi:hypothetical protein